MNSILDPADIAHVCHEANRALQLIQGDSVPSPHFLEAPTWQFISAINGVEVALEGATSAELHKSWMAEKEHAGWAYGPVKDASLKTHPCLVSYDDLPAEQRLKDRVFSAIVSAFRIHATEEAMR